MDTKNNSLKPQQSTVPNTNATNAKADKPAVKTPPEIGGRKGPEPTRFGDWELKGKCVDF